MTVAVTLCFGQLVSYDQIGAPSTVKTPGSGAGAAVLFG